MKPGEVHFVCDRVATICPVCGAAIANPSQSGILGECAYCHAPLRLAVVVDEARAHPEGTPAPPASPTSV